MWVRNETLIKVYENDIVNGTVRIPSSICVIADLAFFRLDNLASIIIPANIRCVETGAFSSCVNLVSVKFENPYCHIECGNDWTNGTRICWIKRNYNSKLCERNKQYPIHWLP